MTSSSVFLDLFKQQPTREQLAAAFDNIEADITYIDDNEIAVYFSPFRIFDRPSYVLGKSIYGCHRPETRPMVTAMLDEFKAGTKDKVSHSKVNTKDGRTVQICYQAMRDPQGKYLGCLEAVTYRDEE